MTLEKEVLGGGKQQHNVTGGGKEEINMGKIDMEQIQAWIMEATNSQLHEIKMLVEHEIGLSKTAIKEGHEKEE